MAEPNDQTVLICRRMVGLRRRRGWSAADLAAVLAGLGHPVSRSVLANMEGGRKHTISVDLAFALAAAFGLTLDQLLGRAECPACDDDPPAGFRCLVCGGERVEEGG